ncbi:MAG TPA: hypothetical protein V6D08_02130 [Candidatus Obscuribacterales bacterium]
MRIIGMAMATLCLVSVAAPPANPAADSQTESKLEKLMDQYDTPGSWQNVPVSGAQPAQAPAQQQPWSRSMASAAQLGSMLGNSSIWRAATPPPGATMPQQGWTASPYVPQGTYAGQNPFNLSPFGILHYLWDDTTYVSSSDPVSLTEVRTDLQQAQQYSAMAESAAKRAKYAADPQERQAAAAEAQQYANMAKAAADRANAIAEGSSSNPADVAALAQQVAAQAQAQASRASATASGSPW